jgi:hypothetical protein
MFQLPFHVDTPLFSGLIALGVASAFGMLLWAYDRETIVAKVLKLFLEWIYASKGIIRAHQIGRMMIISLIVTFGAVAAFGISVGSGLIKNGDPPRPLTMEEFLQKHRK